MGIEQVKWSEEFTMEQMIIEKHCTYTKSIKPAVLTSISYSVRYKKCQKQKLSLLIQFNIIWAEY